jgi:hypothetical protein
MEESICVNRRGLFIKSGAMVTAEMDYKNLNLVSSSAIYSSKGILSGCEVDVIKAENGLYSSKMTGKVSSSMDGGFRSGIKVFGYGSGDSFDAARKASVADAVINANSNFSVEEKYENGKYVSGKSQCSAEGYIFDCSVLSNEVSQDGRYVVKMLCDISTARKDELEIAKKKVVVKGWGVSEAAAKEDAERNAVDKVFGRFVTSTLGEMDGEIQEQKLFEDIFKKGYVKEAEVKKFEKKMGLHEVTCEVEVCQRGKEPSSWSILGIIVIVLGLLALRVHWILALVIVIVGICLL